MYIACFDLEGVLVPEIWVKFAEVTGIPELKRTTRDEPDYTKLMQYRLDILNDHGMKLEDVRRTIDTIQPFEGAREFLDTLRRETQVIILSDTFYEFASPLMEKLGWPTLFANSLKIDPDGTIRDIRMRCDDSKRTTVKGLQAIGFQTIATGDSYNDLGMIACSRAGFLFRTTPHIHETHPDVPALTTYDELLEEIRKVIRS